MSKIKEVKRERHVVDEENEKIKLPAKEMILDNGKIMQLEFELKHAKEDIFKLEKALNEKEEIVKNIEKQLLEIIERNKNKNDDTSIRVFAEVNYIYNLFKELKGDLK